MRRQLKYLNIVLTVMVVLLALNLFKGEPKQAFAQLFPTKPVYSGTERGAIGSDEKNPLYIKLNKVQMSDLTYSIRH